MTANLPYINKNVLIANEAGNWFQTEFDAKEALAQFVGRQDATFHIIGVENRTYTLVMNARFPFIIDQLTYKTNAGTATLAMRINGVNVTSLSALSATSTEQSTSATGENTVAIGDDVTFIVTSATSVTDLFINVWYDRTGAGTA